MRQYRTACTRWLFVSACAFAAFCAFAEPSVKETMEATIVNTMDGIVTRMYETMNETALSALDDAAVQSFITDEERHTLATKYWCFDVDVPVVVSVMRDKEQTVVPFWLPESGFKKTDLTVKNEEYEYEVWQKNFSTGRVELGINGFDKHRPHYFVAVGSQQPGAKVRVTNIVPDGRPVSELRPGALIYHDWPELVLTEVPATLEGQVLLTTIRGRAREAHLIGAFRKTPFPSSKTPDQLALTWSENPRTTQTIQWRTNTEAPDGIVRYKEAGAGGDFSEVKADKHMLEDRLLMNDRYIRRFAAVLRNLKPATTYTYAVGSPTAATWSEESSFTTAPDTAAPFSFVFFGDTHCSPTWGEMLTKSFASHPQTAFYLIAGDVVSTGLYRDEWDALFQFSSPVFRQRPVMPAIGNHDDQDGLGAAMYLDVFGLPENGAKPLESERTYSFEYGNALFLILDATSPIADQTKWLEHQLAETKATWKFAVFHFPPYAPDDDYPEIRREWCTPFDKYHVDMVMSGHVHYYLRTAPIYNGKRVESPADGTVYSISIAIPTKDRFDEKPDYVETFLTEDAFYQTIDINTNKLVFRAWDSKDTMRDELVIEK